MTWGVSDSYWLKPIRVPLNCPLRSRATVALSNKIHNPGRHWPYRAPTTMLTLTSHERWAWNTTRRPGRRATRQIARRPGHLLLLRRLGRERRVNVRSSRLSHQSLGRSLRRTSRLKGVFHAWNLQNQLLLIINCAWFVTFVVTCRH